MLKTTLSLLVIASLGLGAVVGTNPELRTTASQHAQAAVDAVSQIDSRIDAEAGGRLNADADAKKRTETRLETESETSVRAEAENNGTASTDNTTEGSVRSNTTVDAATTAEADTAQQSDDGKKATDSSSSDVSASGRSETTVEIDVNAGDAVEGAAQSAGSVDVELDSGLID